MDTPIVALQLAYVLNRERLGRRRLAERAGLTEMVARVELERMRSEDLVRFHRSGVELTLKGKRRFAPFLDHIRLVVDVCLNSLQLDAVEVAAHATGAISSPAWMLRDEAIREGATALILLVYGPAGWAFSHDREAIRTLNPADADALEALFPDAAQDDLLFIVSGPTRAQANRGLWRTVRAIERQKT